ncbi:MAG: hypothetical protein MUC51_01860 [Anaerolineae bacterium]|nr:hypothetical protein [Anaerolineae bacterium]
MRLSFCENHGFSSTVPSGASSTSSMYWPRIGGVIIALNQKVSVVVSAVGGIVTVWRADEKLSWLGPLTMPIASERLPLCLVKVTNSGSCGAVPSSQALSFSKPLFWMSWTQATWACAAGARKSEMTARPAINVRHTIPNTRHGFFIAGHPFGNHQGPRIRPKYAP